MGSFLLHLYLVTGAEVQVAGQQSPVEAVETRTALLQRRHCRREGIRSNEVLLLKLYTGNHIVVNDNKLTYLASVEEWLL